jgi:hypothetical protein
MIAKLAVTATGMSITTTGTEWWLAPSAIIGGWIFVRLVLEIGESRSAKLMIVLAAACYAAAAAGALGWSPAALGVWSGALTFASPLAGHAIALTGLMIFGRYVVLDVQGLIIHAPPRRLRTKADKSKAAPAVKLSTASVAEAKPSQPAVKAAATNDSWDEEEEHEESGAALKLSKADRKRLRKQQRAA